MYLLLQLLSTETKLLEVQLTLLKESSHIRRQRELSRRVTSRLAAGQNRAADTPRCCVPAAEVLNTGLQRCIMSSALLMTARTFP